MWIKNYISAIAITVIFSALTEALMPETEMKKHISLIAGIVVLIVISKPILSMPFFGWNDIDFTETASEVSVQLSEVLSNAQSKDVTLEFKQKLDENIENEIYNKFSIKCRVSTVLNNASVKYIYIDTYENQNIKNFIEERYALKCVFKKGG